MKNSLASWTVIALCGMASAASAQSRGVIEGSVSLKGNALPGVVVEVRRGDELLATGSSRPDGRLRFEVQVGNDDVFQVRLQDNAFGTRALEIGPRQREARLSEPDFGLVVELRLVPMQSAAPGKPGGGFPTTRGAPPEQPPPPGDNGAIVRVFYATDRARTTSSVIEYSGVRGDGRLQLGAFDVNIPREHRMGSVERPSILTFWKEDPAQHFVIVRRTLHGYDEFYREISAVVGRSSAKSAFVFVHGYNVGFDQAVYRTAQLSYDLGFDGAPILYSWPSEATELGYPVDANNSQWSIPHLQYFLEDVSAKTGARVIHLIAHSMGNQPLVHALREIAIAPRTGPRPRFNQIVLTAPDIDLGTFQQLAGTIRNAGERITLYASSNDVALRLSKKYQGYQRAGDSLPQVAVLPGIDTIDVSAIDETSFLGHSYYGDNRSVLTDLFALIKSGLAPNGRSGLREAGSATNRWWVFRP